jgi:hypothetical protein
MRSGGYRPTSQKKPGKRASMSWIVGALRHEWARALATSRRVSMAEGDPLSHAWKNGASLSDGASSSKYH